MEDKKIVQDTLDRLFNKPQVDKSASFAQQLKTKYSFHAIHNQILSSIMGVIISWVTSCFKKYTEKQFHDKMSQKYIYVDGRTGMRYELTGFDFISDWKRYHKYTFDKIIPTIKRLNLKLDKNELHRLVIEALTKHGWTVTETEKQSLKHTVSRLINILYYNVDTIG
jgi:hypothetical protein